MVASARARQLFYPGLLPQRLAGLGQLNQAGPVHALFGALAPKALGMGSVVFQRAAEAFGQVFKGIHMRQGFEFLLKKHCFYRWRGQWGGQLGQVFGPIGQRGEGIGFGGTASLKGFGLIKFVLPERQQLEGLVARGRAG